MLRRQVVRTRRFTVEAGDSERLDALIARRLDLSRTQAATLIASGRVLVDDARQKASFKADAGSEVTVEALVTAVDEARRMIRTDGYLSVDGRVIYGMKDFTLRQAATG